MPEELAGLKPHERTSSYHRPNRVTAAVSDGWLFVFAGGQTENDSAYFRATKMPKAAEEKEPAPVVIRIQPKGTSITKLKKGRKSFTVKWKKQTKQTTGYQIQYSTKRNFKSGKKTVSIRKNTITKKKIKKLKEKKTYYVRIRTYKKTGGKYYYSAWSKVKKVKTK